MATITRAVAIEQIQEVLKAYENRIREIRHDTDRLVPEGKDIVDSYCCNEEDLQDLDKAQLRLMRNAVYARHGRTFKSVDLQSLWNCYTWYKVNPNYSDELLTDIDKYNIKLIQQHEAQR